MTLTANPFGTSGLSVSRMGLGLAALGRPGYINLGHREDLDQDYDEDKMELQTHRMLDLALQSGINYLDVAQSYGKGELFLSSWLRKKNPHDLVVGSKWGYYYTAGWQTDAEHHEIKEHTLSCLNQQWPESKSRLSPWLRLYQIHSATFESGVLENREVIDRLFEIKGEGMLIGFSVSGPNQGEIIHSALEIRRQGQFLFDAVQATFNILDQSAHDALSKAYDSGLAVIIKEGVANGRLTARNSSAVYFPVLQKVAEEYHVGVDALALAYILAQPFVTTVLSGAATEEHLTSNLKANGIPLSHQTLATLQKLAISPSNYWKERTELAWN